MSKNRGKPPLLSITRTAASTAITSWLVVSGMSQHAAAIDQLQVTKTVTVSSVLPVIGGLLISKLDSSRSLKYSGAVVSVLDTDVWDARKRYSDDLKRRYYNAMMLCKLEDFSVSTFVDPRYKALSFKHLDHWDKDKLTKERPLPVTQRVLSQYEPTYQSTFQCWPSYLS
ncbi:hypothetical protein CYMTET_29361 [Cymbomonas tetramitiformis]|uniref:Uncharacterized protein n=1 Tax=Cymbomonas tetramitiformis TaxID=36881 RepID=A0AAE0FLD6_9CHLO|nr:hypothetical protein CYMTET_29361 [Cymbomonas tetramitiformis]